MSPTNQDLSNDTTFSKIKSRVPVPLNITGTSSDRFCMKLALDGRLDEN